MTALGAPEYLGNDVWLLDLFEQGRSHRTGAYLIRDVQTTLIETGATASHAALLAGLSALGLSPADLDNVIVTHVHLDHAGGAGHLLTVAPNASLVVHPRGARHMADPSKLWQGAQAVYGPQVDALFGPVVPVAPERIVIREHGETLNIGRRTLTFFDSPGHAKHHFTILDPAADALYAGDALGVRYRKELTGWNFEWVMPSTSPVDFDPEALQHTVAFLQGVPFSTVYHAHYGPSPKADACEQVLRFGLAMADWARTRLNPDQTLPNQVADLRSWTLESLCSSGYHPGPRSDSLDLDLFLNTLGLQMYLDRQRR